MNFNKSGVTMARLASCFLAALVCGGVMAQAPSNVTAHQQVTVKVSGEAYNQTHLREYANARVDLKPLTSTSVGWEMIAREFAWAKALTLEGRQEKIEDSAPASAGQNTSPFMAMDMYADKVYKQLAASCSFSDDEQLLKKYYNANPGPFTAPARAKLTRAILPYDLKMDIFPASMWLEVQANAITMEQVGFDKIVARAQKAAPNLKQGDIGWQVLQGNEPLIQALSSAEVGNMVGPQRVGEYVVLLRVDAKIPAQLMPWDSVRIQAKTIAQDHCRDSERQKLMQTLFTRYGVSIEWIRANAS